MSISIIKKLTKKLHKNKLIKSTLRLTLITLFANILGFLVPVYIANTYGISKQTDDFLLSYTIINFIGVIFTGAVTAACVPFLTERLNNKKELDGFVSNILRLLCIYVGLLCIISCIACYGVYYFTGKQIYFYLSISSPIFFFSILCAFYYGILNSFNQFNLAATSPFSRAIIIFACIYLFHNSLGIYSAILGYNIGQVGQFVHLTYVVVNRLKIKLSFKNKKLDEIREFLKTGTYQTLSTAISASSPLVDRLVASFLPTGAISMLDYGDKIFMIFNVMLNSFLTIILSRWAGDVSKGKFKKAEFNKILLYVMCSCILLFLVVLIFRVPLVHLLYPKLKEVNRGMISMLLAINVLGFVFNSGAQIINRGVIAFKATHILVRMSSVRLILNFSFDILFMHFFKLYGIVMSTVVVNIICITLLYMLFINSEYIKKTNLSVS